MTIDLQRKAFFWWQGEVHKAGALLFMAVGWSRTWVSRQCMDYVERHQR